MKKKPPFECFTRQPMTPEESARINTPQAIMDRTHQLIKAWSDRAEKALDTDNPAAFADANAILGELQKIEFYYLHGKPLSPQEAHELFLVSTYLSACVFNLDMRPYGERINIGESVQAGGKKAAMSRHGSIKDRESRYQEMQELYKALSETHPHLGHHDLTNLVGKQFGMSGRRVRDHVKNPKKL